MRRRLAALVLALAVSAPAAADLLVAVPAPTEGRPGELGDELRRGVEAMAATLNAKGGVLGQKLTLVRADDQCRERGGEIAAQTLSVERPAVVIGHPCASAAMAAARVYASAGLLFIAPAVRHPALTDARAGKTIFRLAGRDDRQGSAAARWLIDKAPARRIAIVHDRTAYARAIAEPAAASLAASAGPAVPVLTIVAGKRDYPDIVARLAAEKIEAILFAGFPDEGAIILGGLRKAGLTTAFLGSESLATADFAVIARRDRSTVRALVASDLSSSVEARGAGALELWARAAEAAGSAEPAQVAAVLQATALETQSLGTVSFDEKGDAKCVSFAPARGEYESWVTDEANAR